LPNLGLMLMLFWLSPSSADWLASSGWERSRLLLGLIAAAAAVYFALLHIVGIRLRQLLKPMAS